MKQTLGDIELGDIDDLDDDLNNLQLRPTVKTTTKVADSRPITQQQAIVRQDKLAPNVVVFSLTL